MPILNDGALLVGTGYRPGRERTLLGGDFYDLVQTRDGAVHLMIGDVSGHGADEAALGVCLRVAWRTLTLGGADVDRVLPTLQDVLIHERHAEEIFATVSTVTITPDRTTRDRAQRRAPAAGAARRRAPAGRRRSARRRPDPPLGVFDDAGWPARELALAPRWGAAAADRRPDRGPGGHRRQRPPRRWTASSPCWPASSAGASWAQEPSTLVADLIDAVLELNGGAMLDDVAALLLTGGRSAG